MEVKIGVTLLRSRRLGSSCSVRVHIACRAQTTAVKETKLLVECNDF